MQLKNIKGNCRHQVCNLYAEIRIQTSSGKLDNWGKIHLDFSPYNALLTFTVTPFFLPLSLTSPPQPSLPSYLSPGIHLTANYKKLVLKNDLYYLPTPPFTGGVDPYLETEINHERIWSILSIF